MSAETLRRAAAAMRRNANVAEPGRWKLWGMTVMADPKGTSNVDDGIEVAYAKTPSTTDRLLHTGNAKHVASWHPAVALAVADLLDYLAPLADGPWGPDSTIDRAVRIAETYLGDRP